MITLTDWKTREPVMLDSKEIGAIKVVKSSSYYIMPRKNGKTGVFPVPSGKEHTAIFVLSASGMYDHRIDVVETPDEISELIMAPLLEAGEQIRI